MVRQLNAPSTSRSWKATLAAFLAAGLVASHIMACVESPMSFSPTGDLAFTVIEPFGDVEFGRAGAAGSRVMVLDREGELREIERSSDDIFSGPAYNPAGTQIVYLRAPALTPRETAWLEKEREEARQGQDEDDEAPWIVLGQEFGPDQVGREFFARWSPLFERMSRQSGFFYGLTQSGGVLAAGALVIRDAASLAIAREIPLILPIVTVGDYYQTYLDAQPIFSPDGQFLYLAVNRFAYAMNVATGKSGVLAGNVEALALSPDGQMLAAWVLPLGEPDSDNATLGLLAADGSRIAFIQPAHEHMEIDGTVAWAGNDRLLAVGRGDSNKVFLDAYDREGALLEAIELDLKREVSGRLALSPDGDYLTIIEDKGAAFLSSGGVLLGRAETGDPNAYYDSAVYTRDSRQVAMKLVEGLEDDEDNDSEVFRRRTSIVFFTPGGQELFRVPVPPYQPEELVDQAAPATEETKQ